MPGQIWRHFGDAEDANVLMYASIVQGVMALCGLTAVVLAVLGLWQVSESYQWPVMLLVGGVFWALLGVLGKLLDRGGNHVRYIRCMWAGLALGVFWWIAMAITFAIH